MASLIVNLILWLFATVVLFVAAKPVLRRLKPTARTAKPQTESDTGTAKVKIMTRADGHSSKKGFSLTLGTTLFVLAILAEGGYTFTHVVILVMQENAHQNDAHPCWQHPELPGCPRKAQASTDGTNGSVAVAATYPPAQPVVDTSLPRECNDDGSQLGITLAPGDSIEISVPPGKGMHYSVAPPEEVSVSLPEDSNKNLGSDYKGPHDLYLLKNISSYTVSDLKCFYFTPSTS
jgi:hypothetical protein